MNIPFTDHAGPRPKMFVCYICGREFGSKSLPIHIPQCEKKWMDQEALKPKKEQRPPPKPPTSLDISSIGTPGFDIETYNQQAYAGWKKSLVQCPYCERRFTPEAFNHHKNGCTANHPAKKVGESIRPPHQATTQGIHQTPTANPHKAGSNFFSNMLGKFPGQKGKKQHRDFNIEDREGDFSFDEVGELGDSSSSYMRDYEEIVTIDMLCHKCGIPFDDNESNACSNCGTKREETQSIDNDPSECISIHV